MALQLICDCNFALVMRHFWDKCRRPHPLHEPLVNVRAAKSELKYSCSKFTGYVHEIHVKD